MHSMFTVEQLWIKYSSNTKLLMAKLAANTLTVSGMSTHMRVLQGGYLSEERLLKICQPGVCRVKAVLTTIQVCYVKATRRTSIGHYCRVQELAHLYAEDPAPGSSELLKVLTDWNN